MRVLTRGGFPCTSATKNVNAFERRLAPRERATGARSPLPGSGVRVVRVRSCRFRRGPLRLLVRWGHAVPVRWTWLTFFRRCGFGGRAPPPWFSLPAPVGRARPRLTGACTAGAKPSHWCGWLGVIRRRAKISTRANIDRDLRVPIPRTPPKSMMAARICPSWLTMTIHDRVPCPHRAAADPFAEQAPRPSWSSSSNHCRRARRRSGRRGVAACGAGARWLVLLLPLSFCARAVPQRSRACRRWCRRLPPVASIATACRVIGLNRAPGGPAPWTSTRPQSGASAIIAAVPEPMRMPTSPCQRRAKEAHNVNPGWSGAGFPPSRETGGPLCRVSVLIPSAFREEVTFRNEAAVPSLSLAVMRGRTIIAPSDRKL